MRIASNSKSSFKKASSVVLLFAIVIVAGCIGQGPKIVNTDGLVIRNLYTEPPESDVTVGDVVFVSADLENVGGATARNVIVQLIGTSWLPPTDETLKPLYSDHEEDGDGIKGTTLFQPDPFTKAPGGFKTLKFAIPMTLTLAAGQKVTVPLRIRTEYDYTTSAVAIIQGMSRDRYLRDLQGGKITPLTQTSIPVQLPSGSVPITVNIEGPDKIVVPFSGISSYEEYTYKITFSNIGSQFPITTGIEGRPVDGLIDYVVWVEGPGVHFVDCLGAGAEPFSKFVGSPGALQGDVSNIVAFYGKENWFVRSAWWIPGFGLGTQLQADVGGGKLVVGLNLVSQYLRYPTILDWRSLHDKLNGLILRKGQTVTKSCTVGIYNDPTNAFTWADRENENVVLNIQLKYRYYIESPFSLTITAPIVKQPPAGIAPGGGSPIGFPSPTTG